MADSEQRVKRVRRQWRGHKPTPAMETLEPRLLLDGTPLITEFMADNDETLQDDFEESSDWIEIYNPTPSAIDLDGWHLTDDREDLTQWTFPAITLQPGSYLVVFASGRDLRDPQAKLHTNFGLSKDGDYLALVKPGAETQDIVSEYDFARQLEDVSYGVLYEVQGQTDLVKKGDDATYLIPADGALGLSWIQNGFDDGTWNTGTTGFGFGLGVPGGTSTLVAKGATWRYLDDGSNQGTGWRLSGFDDSSWASGPGELGYGDGGEATVVGFGGNTSNRYITTYFRHTFTVQHAWQISELTVNLRRDDGAVIYLNGQELVRDNMTGDPVDYLTRSLTSVGGGNESTYFPHTEFVNDPTDLLVDGQNVLAVEIHQTSPTSSDISFDLEMIATTSATGLVTTDIEADMLGVGASAYVRIPFTVVDPLEFTELFLRTAYEDGYVAYLNGVEVASGNAPALPQWNSAALTDRPIEEAVQFEGVDLTGRLDLIQAGENVLTIHAMNDAVGDGVFLITPELIAQSHISIQEQYFITPTPDAQNIPGVLGMVADTTFSFDRGFYDAPFQVEITTDTSGAEIRYTLDGSEPTPTTGQKYLNPIQITTTTMLRAMAHKPGYLATNVDTQTYIFLDDVLQQPSNPDGFPDYWNDTQANYQMDPDVINDARYSGTIKDDLQAIPTVSIVADMDDLFGPNGIYANPGGQGTNWERAASVEWIYPDGTTAFQVNAGLRIVGGASRRASNKKHSFRLLFKGQYGPTKLCFPVFGDDAVDSFDTITLRAGFNDVWPNNGNATYLQDRWAAEQQNAAGGYGPHGNFVHLYVNGLYWGLYNPVERPDDAFAASYLGGDKADYDVYNIEGRKEGEATAWNLLLSLINDPVANYSAIQEMLDIPNFADYLIVNQFGGNWDWPQNNWWASYNREVPGKWQFHSWDAEGCLRDLNGNRVEQFGSNLGRIYQQLRQVDEFRQLFADRVHRHLFNGGQLTVAANIALLDEMVAQIDRAIVGESARWGDGYNDTAGLRTRDDTWIPRINWLRTTYFPQRTGIVLQQYKNAGLYPNVVAPTFNVNGTYQHGGDIARGDALTIGAPAGTIYYTLDGTDPRQVGGNVSPTAVEYAGAITLTGSPCVKARVLSGGAWSALNEAGFYIDVTPSLRITEMMYNPGQPTPQEDAAGFEENEDFEFVELTNIGAYAIPLRDVRFTGGVTFTFPSMTIDPGRFVVVVRNQAAFEARYGTGAARIAGEYSGALANGGETIRLDSPTGGIVHDFEYDDAWFPQTDGQGFSLTILDPQGDPALWNQEEGWRASGAPDGTPGADAEGLVPEAIVINEALAHTDGPDGDWIELANTTASQIDITGWFLSDDAGQLDKWQITTPTIIPGGGYKVFTEAADFGAAFALSEFGDDVYLSSNAGGVPGGYREHVDFGASPREKSFGLYPKTTGGTDFALLISPTFEDENTLPLIAPLVINEIMYHPLDAGPGSPYDQDDFEFIELYNRSLAAVDPRQYFLGDGVGFTFGWYDADSFGSETWTLQAGATAAWQADLDAGQYQVLAKWNLTDGEANVRNLDTAAAYDVQHAGGTTTACVNQNVNPTGWVSLGTYTFNAGPAQVTLARGTDDPDRWTIADQVKFVKGPETVIVDDDTPGGFTTTGSDLDEIAPGAYVVIVKNLEAFATRYETAGMTIAGRYSGNLANGGEKVKLYAATNPEATGYIPYYSADYVHYKDGASWPTEPDGTGFSLSRLDAAAYGNDPGNWASGATGGTPGLQNDYLDTTPPTVPANLSGQVVVVPGPQIELAWDASSDPQTWVEHYVIYRDGRPIDTAAGLEYTDANVLPATPYVYQVSAVNRDAYESDLSAEVMLAVPGIVSITTPEDVIVEVRFSEPLDTISAGQTANYVFDNTTVTAAGLHADGVTVILTTSQLQAEQTYTLTVNNVQTLSGAPMPPDLQVSFVYSPHGAGYILREYWLGIGGSSVADLTGNANFPDNPSGTTQPTLFEAPTSFANDYGTRMLGYVHPPVTGDYVFWIASDDNSQLFLSTDIDPANKVQIAYVPSHTGSRVWTSYAQQQSAPVHLEAGRRYYIEALHKEGGGGDNLAVAWQTPEDAVFNNLPIDGIHLSPYVEGPVATVNIQATDPSAAEEGLEAGEFTISRVGSTDGVLTVYYTVGGTAVPADYVGTLSGHIDLPAGAASATITITPEDDPEDENSETVILTLAGRPHYAIGAASATVTITDNDAAPDITVGIAATDPSAAEQGLDPGEFTITRVGIIDSVLTVYYTVAGTASDADYVETLSGHIDLPAGAASATIAITPEDDPDDESNETVILVLTGSPQYAIGAASATVTIADNDLPTVSIAATDPDAAEQDCDPGEFTISRAAVTDAAVTVYYSVGGSAEPGDYTPVLSQHVQIPAGQASVTITITPEDDGQDELDETVVLTLTPNAAYVIGAASAAVTIADNDLPTVGIEATDPDAAEEGLDPGEFTITRVGITDSVLTVYYTVAGTASDADYTETLAGQIDLPAGAASATITITPEDDPDDERNETVILTLTGRPQYAIGADSDTVTIADNDLPTVSIAASDPSADEQGRDPGAFRITRVGNTDYALTVYCTVSGTAAACDYQPALPCEVDIRAGRSSVTISIMPLDDDEHEPNETVVLTLVEGPTYVLGTSVAAEVTIADNDNTPQVVAVVLNPDDDRTVRGVSEIDPSALGVQTVRVTFNEEVVFAPGDVTADKVEFDDEGNQTAAVEILPENITVSATAPNEMTITFADSWQQTVDTWVRITLADTITDLDSHPLDGEPKGNSSGLGYIYDAALDLPSGNGAAGGDAVFYVGSLRGDLRGFGPEPQNDPPNGTVDSWDIGGFTQKFQERDLDADFRGFGPEPANDPPNGDVDSWDIGGFTSWYSTALAAGAHLGNLPTDGGGGMAAGAPSPLPLLAAESAALTDSPEAALLAFADGSSLRENRAAASADRGDSETDLAVDWERLARQPMAAPDILQPIAAGEEAFTGRRAAAASDVPAPAEDPPGVDDVPQTADGLVDVLSLPGLDVQAVL